MDNDDDGGREDATLQHFEKNRYFQGKLMTARDMRTEQEYHTARLETITQYVTGTGIVSGLDVTEVTAENDELQVTLQPGLAIDGVGRPVVVRNPTNRTVPEPTGDELYLYIEFESEAKDPVPVPGADPERTDDSEESRVLEVFDLTVRETPPANHDSPTRFEVSDLTQHGDDFETVAAEIADAYHQSDLTDKHQHDTALFLGSFRQTPDGEWQSSEATHRRPYVYDNEMLFSLLVDHIADTDNPHDTRVGEPTEYMENELDQVEGFGARLQQLQNELTELTEKVDAHTDYTTQKSLKTLIRFFDDLADSFEGQGEITRSALSIVNATREAVRDEVHDDPEAYLALVDQLLVQIETLTAELADETTENSHEQFQSVVDDLARLSEEDATVIEIARTIDRLAETADMLEQRTEVRETGDN